MINYKRFQKVITIYLLVIVMIVASGCASASNDGSKLPPENNAPPPFDYTAVTKYEGSESPYITNVYTTKRQLALTFNGLGNTEDTMQLLDTLEQHQMKATFFVPGMRVAEEPDLIKEMISRGHEVENNTLTRPNVAGMSYADIFKEIHLSSSIIEGVTERQPRYVRTRTGDANEEVQAATAHSGLDAVIGYSLNLKDTHLEKELKDPQFLRLYINRGAIISIDVERNERVIEMIPIIAAATDEVKYKLVSLAELMKDALDKKPLEEINGFDAAKVNIKDKHVPYDVVYQGKTDDKKIALTFDDWGTDYTITSLLDIMDTYGIKSTFFLRANGVEHNPSLARSIVDEGHEVANHTYSHPVITSLTPEMLQNEIVKAHQVITEAIQQQPSMFFRPPTGEIDDESAQIIAATGYQTIAMYDVTVLDWDAANDASEIESGVLEQAKEGSIILLHMLDDIHTAEALPRIIEALQSKGYTFVTMSELLK